MPIKSILLKESSLKLFQGLCSLQPLDPSATGWESSAYAYTVVLKTFYRASAASHDMLAIYI